MDQPWRIQMFGGFRAEREDRVVSSFRSQKTAVPLAHLAFHSDRSHPREVLAELLWPDSDPDTSRTRLRIALSSLRRELEPDDALAGSVMQADRHSVQLNPRAITTDVALFEAALEAAKEATSEGERIRYLEQAVTLYAGEFLSGYDEDWILTEQRRVADVNFQAF